MSVPILNPGSKWAHLPSDVASQLQTVEFVLVATLGFYGWEILTGLRFDYFMAGRALGMQPQRRSAGAPPPSGSARAFSSLVAVVYLVTRYSSLVYAAVFVALFLQPHAPETCSAWQVGAAIPAPFAIVTPTLLLYFRLIAISGFKLWAIIGVGLVWVGEAVSAFFLIPAAIGNGIPIGDTGYCTVGGFGPQGQPQTIYTLFLNTILFVAIAFCVLRLQSTTDVKPSTTIRRAVNQGLPSLSQRLLADGLFYYIITVITNTINVVFVFSPSIAPALRLMWTVPNAAITAAMVCRITRRLIESGSGALSSRMARHVHQQRRASTIHEASTAGDSVVGYGTRHVDSHARNQSQDGSEPKVGRESIAGPSPFSSPRSNLNDVAFASPSETELGRASNGLPSLSVTGSLSGPPMLTVQTETFQTISRPDRHYR